jgi:type VI protein secretion system component Hcp
MHIPAAILTRRGRLAAIAAVGASLALPLSAQAATSSATLTVPDFAGKTGPIPLIEWTWGAENTQSIGSATSGAGGGKAQLKEFKIKKPVDAASPLFFNELVKGQHFDNMRMDVPLPGGRKASGPTGMSVCLSTVNVKSDDISGDDSSVPTENIVLEYGAVSETYSSYDGAGNVVSQIATGWDQLRNVPFSDGC